MRIRIFIWCGCGSRLPKWSGPGSTELVPVQKVQNTASWGPYIPWVYQWDAWCPRVLRRSESPQWPCDHAPVSTGTARNKHSWKNYDTQKTMITILNILDLQVLTTCTCRHKHSWKIYDRSKNHDYIPKYIRFTGRANEMNLYFEKSFVFISVPDP
jgi:hypothetical protein